jgi:hypothetical protein
VEEGRAAAQKILTAHLPELHAVAKALLEKETLSGADIRALLCEVPGVANPSMERPIATLENEAIASAPSNKQTVAVAAAVAHD